MAGLSYEDLIKKARQGKKPVTASSSAAPSQVPMVDIDPPQGTPTAAPSKRDRPRSAGKETEADLPPKKPKPTKEKDQSRRAPPLDLEHPSEFDFERFKADPLLFASEIARAGSRLLAKMKQGEEERAAGMLLSATNLWLEGDNLDKTDKLNRAYDYISELRRQLEAEKQKVKEAEAALQPTKEALNEARTSLKSMEEERDTAVTRLSKAEEGLRLERERASKLGEELSSTEKRADHAEAQWQKMDNEYTDLIHSTIRLCDDRFNEAIRQVRYVHPDLELNETIINSKHTMVGGRIVVPERRNSEGQVVEPEVVVFERP